MKTKIAFLFIGLLIGAAAASGYFVHKEMELYNRYLRHQEAIRGGVLEPARFNAEELYDLKLYSPDGSPAPPIRESKDKVLFVSFWATWCKPCQVEFPEIEALKAASGDRVAFFMLSDESPELIGSVANRYKLPFFSYKDAKLLPAYLRTYEILPRSFIIKNGRIEFERWAEAPWGGEKAVQLLKDIEASN